MTKHLNILKILFLIVICGCLWDASVCGQDALSVTISSIIQLPKGFSLEDHVYKDINQDGLKDIVLSVSNDGKPFERSLRIYYQKKDNSGFELEPDEIISLTTDVVAFACADVDNNPGAEILLFTANACFGYRLNQEDKGKIFKIADYEFLWQIPDSDKVFSWQEAVLDFNNDGRMDFVIPQPEGIKILFQKDTEFVSTPLLEVPIENVSNDPNTRFSRNRSSFDFSARFENRGNAFGGRQENKPLVNVNHSVNVPVFTDCDGDNLYDIVIHSSNCLYVWEQEQKEPFFTNQNINLNISKMNDKDKKSGSSENQYVLDLNGDKYFDYLLFKRDQSSKKVFTQILVYLNQKNSKSNSMSFNAEGIPQQLIKIAGLPGKAKFHDINKDGYPDLSFMIFNPDLLDQVETLASKSIKLQYLSFFNDKKGLFSRNPDISHEFDVSLEGQNQYGTEPIQFIIDFNNDGLLDVLVRDKSNHIGLRLLKKTKNTIKILDKDVWDMTIPEDAHIVYEKTDSDLNDVLFITSPAQIMYVRFK